MLHEMMDSSAVIETWVSKYNFKAAEYKDLNTSRSHNLQRAPKTLFIFRGWMLFTHDYAIYQPLPTGVQGREWRWIFSENTLTILHLLSELLMEKHKYKFPIRRQCSLCSCNLLRNDKKINMWKEKQYNFWHMA